MLYISFDIPGPISGTLQVLITLMLPSPLFQVEATLFYWPQLLTYLSKLFLATSTLITTGPKSRPTWHLVPGTLAALRMSAIKIGRSDSCTFLFRSGW